MTGASTSAPAPADDDLAWARALAGQAAPGSDPATAAEAALLRQALRQWPADEAPLLTDASGLQRLLAAAQDEGLGAHAAGCAGCARRRVLIGRWFKHWWGRWASRPASWGGLALAGLLGWAVLPALWSPPADEAVLRSTVGVVQRTAEDPRAARDAVADRLAAAGADVRRYERAGRHGLDAELPPRADPVLLAWLAAQGLVPGPAGEVLVEYRQPGP